MLGHGRGLGRVRRRALARPDRGAGADPTASRSPSSGRSSNGAVDLDTLLDAAATFARSPRRSTWLPWDQRPTERQQPDLGWIRVSQFWAGAGYGALYTPRVGHEVLVAYLQGDPDQPVIVGRVYNVQHTPPYDAQKEPTKSTVKSQSAEAKRRSTASTRSASRTGRSRRRSISTRSAT